MASGFITLSNGQDWSARWSSYDWVLETVMNELRDSGLEKTLKDWICYILPNEEKGDVESGYCYHKATDGKESILRIIDTRLMKPEFVEIFWQTVKKLASKLQREEGIGFYINELYDIYISSLNEKIEEPNDDDTLKEIFFVGNFAIGK